MTRDELREEVRCSLFDEQDTDSYFIFSNGSSAVRYNGQVYTEKEFNELYPLHGEAKKTEREAQRSKDNPDRTKQYLL